MNSSFLNHIRSLTPTLSAGIIAGDVMHLAENISTLEKAGVELLHFDIMDGVFCPNITAGAWFVKSIKTKMIKDVHLMIVNPEVKLESFVEVGADIITVHYEAGATHIHALLQSIKKLKNANSPDRNIIAGIAINPGTPVEAIKNVLDVADMITILAVNPGWQHQSFIKTTKQKIETAISLIGESGRDILLCLDGGITKDNIVDVSHMGTDIVVAGSAIFDGKDIIGNAKFFIDTLKKGRTKSI